MVLTVSVPHWQPYKKRGGDIEKMYESLTKFENIYQAYRQSAKGKRHKNDVIQYETNLHMQL